MKRFSRSFRQLRWKLTLSYALTAVVSFLLVVVLVFGGALSWLGFHISLLIQSQVNSQAVEAVPYLEAAQQNPTLLQAWLQITAANDDSQSSKTDPSNYYPIFLTMVNSQGTVLGSTGSQPLAPGTNIQTQLSVGNAAQLRAVLKDRKGSTSFAGAEDEKTLLVISPIVVHGQVQGALVLKMVQPDANVLFIWFFYVATVTVFAAIILAIITGPIFGYITARGVSKRLKKLSVAANSWGHGDFAARARDTSQDELGQMASQLNQMAEQLQNLLETRQQLATLEERNRLARDLHDSVKQQVFAVSMQIAATRILLKRDVNAAEERLTKAEVLVKQAQQELTTLIRELRPVALDGKGLVDALRELQLQWSQQNEIVANLQVEGSRTLPLNVEEALYRVAQEALSNIARHSKATLVQLTLSMSSSAITLAIQDNGQGFDPARLERHGVGLLSMQERMKALGGEMRVESTPGQGTRMLARCSYPISGTSDAESEQEKKKNNIALI
ncbi:MAG TPA: histidine kinase [Ktedonobacteraceae bacterium]